MRIKVIRDRIKTRGYVYPPAAIYFIDEVVGSVKIRVDWRDTSRYIPIIYTYTVMNRMLKRSRYIYFRCYIGFSVIRTHIILIECAYMSWDIHFKNKDSAENFILMSRRAELINRALNKLVQQRRLAKLSCLYVIYKVLANRIDFLCTDNRAACSPPSLIATSLYYNFVYK